MTAFPSLVTVRQLFAAITFIRMGRMDDGTSRLRCERMCLKKPDLGSTLPKGCADAGQSHYQK